VGAIVGWAWSSGRRKLEVGPAVAIQRHQDDTRSLPMPVIPADASAENLELFRACAGDDFAACIKLGARYTGGIVNTRVDLPLGFSLFERGCGGGVGLACAEVAVGYGRGRGVPPDPGMAKTYSDLACSLGVQQACGAH
jgi:TPR repeat protein